MEKHRLVPDKWLGKYLSIISCNSNQSEIPKKELWTHHLVYFSSVVFDKKKVLHFKIRYTDTYFNINIYIIYYIFCMPCNLSCSWKKKNMEKGTTARPNCLNNAEFHVETSKL